MQSSASSPQTVLDHLIAQFPHAKKTTLRGMIQSKRVWINGVPALSLKQPLAPTDTLEIATHEAAQSKSTTLAHGLKLLHFDSDIVIVEKPTGLLTATDAAEKRPTALRILRDYFKKSSAKNRIYLIHRLDKDASGLLVFARNQNAYQHLKQQFFDHTITRRYDALVHAPPAAAPLKKSARLEHYLIEDAQGLVRTTENAKLGKLAILDYTLLATNKKIAHLQCTLHTGRKHQIRVQLQSLGHPVLGDPLYSQNTPPKTPDNKPPQDSGLKTQASPPRLALHASHLKLTHPTTSRQVEFNSPMPKSFAHLMRT